MNIREMNKLAYKDIILSTSHVTKKDVSFKLVKKENQISGRKLLFGVV